MRIKTVALAATLLFAACNNDIDEFRFKGHVVGAEMCSSSQIGYVIDILSPDSIGGEILLDGATYRNAVMGYKASRILHQGDTFYGVAHFTESYAALNCFGLINNNLPEVILLSVDEDHE
ncbi:MAG: hypothetical protein J6X58_03645 [Bacteroidales bacterium]|nr:hypothetical protein [Bacteroidales bacterium]